MVRINKNVHNKMLYKEYLQKQNAHYNYSRHTLVTIDGLGVSLQRLKERLYSQFDRRIIDLAISDLKKVERHIAFLTDRLKDDMTYTKETHQERVDKNQERADKKENKK